MLFSVVCTSREEQGVSNVTVSTRLENTKAGEASREIKDGDWEEAEILNKFSQAHIAPSKLHGDH